MCWDWYKHDDLTLTVWNHYCEHEIRVTDKTLEKMSCWIFFISENDLYFIFLAFTDRAFGQRNRMCVIVQIAIISVHMSD